MEIKKGIKTGTLTQDFGTQTGGAPALSTESIITASTQTVVQPAGDKDFGRKPGVHRLTMGG